MLPFAFPTSTRRRGRYSEVLGLSVLSPPYRMAGAAMEQDMGELVPSPVVVKAAIVGLRADDQVLELIEYPEAGIKRGLGGSHGDALGPYSRWTDL